MLLVFSLYCFLYILSSNTCVIHRLSFIPNLLSFHSLSLLLCVAICFRMALDLYYFQSKLCYLPLVVMVLWKLQLITWTHGVLPLNSAIVSHFFPPASTHSKLFFWVKQAKESPNGWATESRQMSSANESKSSLELCSKAYIFNNRMALVVCKSILMLLEGSVIFGVGSWYGKLGDVQPVFRHYIIRCITHDVVFTQPYVTPNL